MIYHYQLALYGFTKILALYLKDVELSKATLLGFPSSFVGDSSL